MWHTETEKNAFQFLDLVVFKREKSFKNEDDFNEFLNMNLKIVNKNGWTPITFLFFHNTDKAFSLPVEKIIQICEKSDIFQTNNLGYTYLHYILTGNKKYKLKLENHQIISLLNKSDLTYTKKHHNWTYLHYILASNNTENLGFNNQQLIEIYEKTIQALAKKGIKREIKNFKNYTKNNFPDFISLYEKNKLDIHPKFNKNLRKQKL